MPEREKWLNRMSLAAHAGVVSTVPLWWDHITFGRAALSVVLNGVLFGLLVGVCYHADHSPTRAERPDDAGGAG